MSSTRVLSLGTVVVISFLLGVFGAVSPPPAHAAWVNATGTAFQVGETLHTIAAPICGVGGGTSLALVSGSKLNGVDPVDHPVVLVVSCLDSADAAVRDRLDFISPISGTVVKQILTATTPPAPPLPGNGWAYLVHRPDRGDLLGCRDSGEIYSIDYSRTTAAADGAATKLTSPTVTSCRGLAWDADEDVISVGTSSGTANDIVRLFNDSATTTTLLGTLPSPCNIGTVTTATKGLAVSGGVLLVACDGDPLVDPSPTIRRIDKNFGVVLGVHGSLTATGLPFLAVEPGLSSLTCDPRTFTTDTTGKDLFTDALWSRRGGSVNALQFPAYTCGMPSNSLVFQGATPYSPLAAGLGVLSGLVPGAVPRAACFDTNPGPNNGRVIDLDGDGVPDCWESTSSTSASPGSGIDFDGDNTVDLQLCVQVNTNGDGVTLTTECAVPAHKDLFVEIDYMQDHKPDPKALSQTQSPATKVNGVFVGVKSVREAFAAAPVSNPDNTIGIRLHYLVDEQVTFTPLSGGPSTRHADLVAFTPCTPPASSATDFTKVADFDTIKAGNFGTAAERGTPPGTPPTQTANIMTLNAKRLTFRYILFAHNVVANSGGGSNSSGCGEIGGNDAVITLGSFAKTTVGTVSHNRGTTDQQAGTFMHELGHTVGFDHGGLDSVNCKPNYRSVMNYTRQFAGSPIPNRRLDYSRAADPVLNLTPTLSGFLDEFHLDETVGLGDHSSLGPIPPSFPLTDQIVFGPNSWSLQTPATAKPINWNRTTQPNPTNVSADLNLSTATAGCDGAGTILEGQDDWSSVLYRASAAINFAGGETSEEMTSDNEQAFFQGKDADGNGAGDLIDCGGPVGIDGTPGFSCTHRLDVPDGIAQPANFRIVVFSEQAGNRTWNAPTQVIPNQKNGTATCPSPLANGTTDCTLTVSVGDVVMPVKTPASGTCSAKNMPDPITGQMDGIKDLVCQVYTANMPPLPHGTVFVVVSGFFLDNGQPRAFSARREVTIP